MSFDMIKIQEHIKKRALILGQEVDTLNANSNNSDDYRRFHDEHLGALFVCLHLENDASLASISSFLAHLGKILEEKFDAPSQAFAAKDFDRGVASETKRIINYLVQ